MNPKRKVIEQAIMDLEENREIVSQIYNEWTRVTHGPDYYEKVQELDDAMEKTRRERKNIAVRLFHDYVTSSGKPNSEPNYKYYDPNPTPVFSVGDFHRGPGLSRSYPVITGRATRSSRNGDRTLARIDKFIGQLKRKMKTRKDLQESSPFQLTEAKLKEMILEALKDSSFRSFGIPTPDEKLRSQLGDQTYDKLQSLNPEQRDVMKQAFDSDYPREIKQESLTEMIEAAGFKLYDVSKYTKAPTMHARYNNRTWERGDQNTVGSSSFEVQYNVYGDFLRYSVRLFTKAKSGSTTSKSIADGRVSIPPMFELSLKTEQDLRAADAIMLSTEKQAIEEALEQLK